MSSNNQFSMVITTCPTTESAKLIAQSLVNDKLAACVQIMAPMTSFYHWQDQICQDSEIALHIKCCTQDYQAIEQRICELHPYDVPQIIALSITDGLPRYLDWIKQTCQR
ncbi:divalent-cation tolerance protein CutA [Shewanella marina]|uniref:divalent-cation tolerance protein CutA n=1 Tax=Shewanella marina TaxID=487319 RepID=UPI0035710A76